jgi:membrane protease YdiL (CAAX protease family)
MIYDEKNSTGAAPARARSEDPSEELPPPAMESVPPSHQDFPGYPPPAQFQPEIAEDLRVPWGWSDVATFVIFALIAAVVVTRGLAQIAVSFLGVSSNVMFGDSMTTAKSVVVLISQAVLDGGAILYLYLMLLVRSPAPFWRAIGWRQMPARATAVQFLTRGAVLALIATFVSGYFNSKESLPIEQLLQARVSMTLFAVLGVLVAPIVEETIFRGFLYPVIARRLGVIAGVIITGILFGLMHAAQLWGGWGQIVLLIVVGVVLTWVRARTGTVTASYFVHLGYNGLQLLGYLVYIIGASHH